MNRQEANNLIESILSGDKTATQEEITEALTQFPELGEAIEAMFGSGPQPLPWQEAPLDALAQIKREAIEKANKPQN